LIIILVIVCPIVTQLVMIILLLDGSVMAGYVPEGRENIQ
jgi:hypothetical protein